MTTEHSSQHDVICRPALPTEITSLDPQSLETAASTDDYTTYTAQAQKVSNAL